MPGIPAEIVPQLKMWWFGQDPANQAIFEAIYMDAPGAVSTVISGGAWTADSAEPGLAAQLGADGGEISDLNDQIPRLYADDVVITPFHPMVGQAITFTWVESNQSAVETPAYFSDVYVMNVAGEAVGSGRLAGAALPPGGSLERTWTLDTGVASADQHTVVVYMNAEGADQASGVAGAQGFRTQTAGMFSAGTGDQPANDQDWSAWSTAISQLDLGVSDRSGQSLQEAINWLASLETVPEAARAKLEKVSARLNLVGADLRELSDDETIDGGLALVGRAALDAHNSPNGPASEAVISQIADALATLVGV